MVLRHVPAALAAAALLSAPSARGEDGTASLLVFGGESVEGHVWQEDALPFAAHSGHQVQIGAALADMPLRLPWGFSAGFEAGIALRHDGDRYGPSGSSAEIWAGPAIRHDGIAVGPIRLHPALTVGYSAVTESHGLERTREIEADGEAALLYFMAPEIAVSSARHPGIELVYRVQHRSGGVNIGLPALGRLGDTTNANVLGLRWRF